MLNLGIIGKDIIKTNNFIKGIINNTHASKDQDHIKMNIVINEFLTEGEIIEKVKCLEKIGTTHLCLYNLNVDFSNIKQNTNLIIINEDLNEKESVLINKIIKLHEETL